MAESTHCEHGIPRTSVCDDCTPPTLAASLVPTGAPALARCRGCGFTVEKPGDVCAECADKPQFQAPVGRMVLGAQPEPAYLREGGFRRPESLPEEEL